MSTRLSTVGRSIGSLSVERLDNLSEVTLGLCSTCVVTFMILLLAIPIFDLGTMPWVHSWEGQHNYTQNTTTSTTTATTTLLTTTTVTTRMSGHTSMSDYKKSMEKVCPDTAACFKKMQGGKSGEITKEQYVKFASTFDPPLNTEQVEFTFDGIDQDKSNTLSETEWTETFKTGNFYWVTTSTTTTKPEHYNVAAFKNDVKAWGGSMEEAGEKMDLDGDGKIRMDEFLPMAQEIVPDLKRDKAEELFNELDGDKDGKITMTEFDLSTEWFDTQLAGLGTPKTLVEILDMDADGKLNREEFGHLGEMLDPPTDVGVFFDKFDVNHNNFMETDEFHVLKTTTATTTQTLHPDVKLTKDDLKAYVGVPCIVQGKSVFVITFPNNATLPADGPIKEAFKQLFKDGIEKELSCNLKFQGSGEATAMDEAEIGEAANGEKYKIKFDWEADTSDGGSFQQILWDKGAEIEAKVFAQIADTDNDWLKTTLKSRWYNVFRAEYYGNAAYTLPKGPSLMQKMGQRGKDADGTFPESDNGSPPYEMYQPPPVAV